MTNEELTELVKRAAEGDHDAFAAIYRQKHKLVYAMISRGLPGKSSIWEDVEQEVWLAVFKSFPKLRDYDSFPSWLNRIAHNKIANVYRKALGRAVESHEEIATNPSIIEEYAEEIYSNVTAVDILDCLPFAYSRQAVYERLVLGMTLKESASYMGIGYEAAASRYKRGIHWMREHSDKLGIEK